MSRSILLSTSTFPRSADDAQTPRFVFDLGRELTRWFQVFVLAPHAPGSAREETLEGLRIHRFRYALPERYQALAYGSGIVNNLRRNPLNLFQIPSFLYSQRRALDRLVRRHRIGLVNSHWMVPQGWTSAGVCARRGIPHVLTIHSAGLFLLRRLPLGGRVARGILRRCQALYTVSRHNHRMLEDLVGGPVPGQILPMGVDTGFFAEPLDPASTRRELRLPAGGLLILFVGRLARIKGVIYLLRALPRILESLPQARLVLVGSGDQEPALREEARRLNLEEAIVWAGPRSRGQVRRYLAACDLCVLPSIRDRGGQVEGFPVALLEALASGKPVIGTRLGGVAEAIVDGVNGFTVPPADPGALARAVLKVAERGAGEFSAAARASAQRFDWKNIAENYRDTFDRLLASSG